MTPLDDRHARGATRFTADASSIRLTWIKATKAPEVLIFGIVIRRPKLSRYKGAALSTDRR
jgi:hypothetical protein